MHCLLQQLGKEITRGQCLDEPGKRKFLVDALEISDVLADETVSFLRHAFHPSPTHHKIHF